MSYYEEKLRKAQLQLQYVEKGFHETIGRIANEIGGHSVQRPALEIADELRLACDVLEEAMDDVESATERVREENERYETV